MQLIKLKDTNINNMKSWILRHETFSLSYCARLFQLLCYWIFFWKLQIRRVLPCKPFSEGWREMDERNWHDPGAHLPKYSRDPFVCTFKMAAKQVAQTASKTVFKPLLSTSHVEARRRVMNLYRAWWREVLICLLLYAPWCFKRHNACGVNWVR